MNSKPRKAIIYFGIWILAGVVLALLSYASQLAAHRPARLGFELQTNVVRYFLWGALSPLIYRFCRRFPIDVRRPSLRNLLLYVPAVFFFAALQQFTHLTLAWFVAPGFRYEYASIIDLYRGWMFAGIYLGLIVSTLIILGAHALIYYQDVKAGEIKQAELKAQLAQARLQALKMQIHPHFLFNTLHSISSLVLDDPAKANSMLARLGDFLRLTLEHSDEQVVRLKEEIEFLRCYLEIEQVRFEDRLTVEFEIQPAALSAQVPHMILQPVVENAIRHAIAPRASSGHIRIGAVRLDGVLRVEVTDDGPGINANGNSFEKRGMGLSNVRSRLTQLYGQNFRFEMKNIDEGGLSVVMETPFQTEAVAESEGTTQFQPGL